MTPTIPGESTESYNRRCLLDKTRNKSVEFPNQAELEYQMIWNREVQEYDERQRKTHK